jgi:hypothetical protein
MGIPALSGLTAWFLGLRRKVFQWSLAANGSSPYSGQRTAARYTSIQPLDWFVIVKLLTKNRMMP